MRTATCPPCRRGAHEDCWIACGCPACNEPDQEDDDDE